MSLEGKVAVITGASAGIGEEIARELAAAGASLVLTARRRDRLEALAATLHTPTAILDDDVTAPDLPQRLLTLAEERFGRVDILINNAGLLSISPIDDVDLNLLDQVIAVNFSALVRFSYVFARALKAQGTGAIINVSSIGAFVSVPMSGVYSATKAAVESFTAALRIELGGSGVKVGSIAPGSTATEILDVVRANGEPAWASTTAKMAASDIAAAVRFMLEQPDRANIARLSIYSAEERV